MKSVYVFDMSMIDYNIRTYLQAFASPQFNEHVKYLLGKTIQSAMVYNNQETIDDVLAFAAENGYIPSEVQTLVESQSKVIKEFYFDANNVFFNLDYNRRAYYELRPDNCVAITLYDYSNCDPVEAERQQLMQAIEDGEYIPEKILRQYGLI